MASLEADLNISFAQILKITQSVPEIEIKSWEDVSQIDIRPSTGAIRIRAKANRWEIQIDGTTGAVTGKTSSILLVSVPT